MEASRLVLRFKIFIMKNTLRSIVDSFTNSFPFLAVEMSLLVSYRFWNAFSIQTSLINLLELDLKPSAMESLCLYYDAYSLIQVTVALLCLTFVFSALFHIGSYWGMGVVYISSKEFIKFRQKLWLRFSNFDLHLWSIYDFGHRSLPTQHNQSLIYRSRTQNSSSHLLC